MSDLLRVLLVLFLVLGNAFFVAAEYALVTARRSRLAELANGGSRRAKIALQIMDSPIRFIGTVQLGITAFSIALGAIGEPLVEHFLDPVLATTVAFILAFTIVTYLHVTLGELVPKAIALTKNESTALWVALPIEAFYLATYPIVWFLQESANRFTNLFGIEPAAAGVVAHNEQEIRMIVAAAEDTGVIATTEEEMLYKVFDFADKEVHEVMVPRPQVVAVKADMPAEEALGAVLESPYTRYPVYRDSLDEIIGSSTCATCSRRCTSGELPRSRSPSSSGPSTSSPRRRISRRCSPSSASRTSTWQSSSTSTARCRAS